MKYSKLASVLFASASFMLISCDASKSGTAATNSGGTNGTRTTSINSDGTGSPGYDPGLRSSTPANPQISGTPMDGTNRTTGQGAAGTNAGSTGSGNTVTPAAQSGTTGTGTGTTTTGSGTNRTGTGTTGTGTGTNTNTTR